MIKKGGLESCVMVLSYYSVLWTDSHSVIIMGEVHRVFAGYSAYANMVTDFPERQILRGIILNIYFGILQLK